MKHIIGQRVVIWSKDGEGIYDGNTVYIHAWMRGDNGEDRYGVSEYRNGSTAGYIPESQLLTVAEWQALLEAGKAETWFDRSMRKLRKAAE